MRRAKSLTAPKLHPAQLAEQTNSGTAQRRGSMVSPAHPRQTREAEGGGTIRRISTTPKLHPAPSRQSRNLARKRTRKTDGLGPRMLILHPPRRRSVQSLHARPQREIDGMTIVRMIPVNVMSTMVRKTQSVDCMAQRGRRNQPRKNVGRGRRTKLSITSFSVKKSRPAPLILVHWSA